MANLEALRPLFVGTDARQQLLILAQTAEIAERFEDMARFVKEIIMSFCHVPNGSLSHAERDVFVIAYKNVAGSKRDAVKALVIEEEDPVKSVILAEYKSQLEAELTEHCVDALNLVEGVLIKNNVARKDDMMVFYLKTAGDFNRYLAEVSPGKKYEQKANYYYTLGVKMADEILPATNSLRLGLALNFSVFHYEIIKDKKAAISLAKGAFERAISKLDALEENEYKDSTLIMQLLRDNLTLWTADPQQ